MPNHQELTKEILQKIDNRKSTYGSVSVKSSIMKHQGQWKNILTKILPLPSSDSYTLQEKLDYGDFVLVEKLITLEDLIEVIRKLPEKGTTSITIGDYEVQVQVENLVQDTYKYDSGTEYLKVGWFYEKYQYRSQSQHYSSEPIVTPDLPLFPDSRTAIEKFIGIDFSHYSEPYGIILCLPNYGVRIDEVNIASKEIRVKIQPKTEKIENIIGKLYCRRDGETKQEDIKFETETANITIGFMPDFFNLALVSRISGEILDTRRFYSSWEPQKGITFEIPEYELLELIRHGETETAEFKEDIGKPEELAETAVAFANGEGGIILIGVDNHANIIGIGQRDYEGTITNILRSHCEPQIEYKIDRRQLEEKTVVLLHIHEGKDKPYTVREKGVYVRANATDRIATRYELDKFYEQRRMEFRSY
jgi:hypothetical protein